MQKVSLTTNDNGDGFVPVTLIRGLRARIDFARQKLFVTASPSLLPATDLRLDEREASDPAPSVPGAFIGYDVLGGAGAGTRIAAAQIEAGGFAGAWNTTGTWQLDARGGIRRKTARHRADP